LKRHIQSLHRRQVLKGMAALSFLATTALSSPALAQQDQGSEFAFDYDSFSARMQAMAAGPYQPASASIPDSIRNLDYDAYRMIQFRPEAAHWSDSPAGYRIHAFHPGWLFNEPVRLFEVDAGTARPIAFAAEDFDYHDAEVEAAIGAAQFPGVAGFRLNYPLNRPEAFDELISFLGASYFRALGRGNIYGLSARGLLLNSWREGPEEFPRFSEFYLEKPTDDGPLTLYAALDSESVTGAYRFVIIPASDAAQETAIDVTARLYFRKDVQELGVAPLTSMFLYAEANRGGFDDYRPQVHDSNGLLIERETGEVLWRALNNDQSLGNSYLWENNPRAFGLYQRGRDFESYQDAGAHYERRPSLRIEPVGDWGEGHVRLIEIPATLEADDNIVAFWIPAEPAVAGSAREFSYRMLWGNLDPERNPERAYVVETRAGAGGVSGVVNAANLRKFVIDFKGGELDAFEADAPIDVLASAAGGIVVSSVLSRIDANGVWRLVLDIAAEDTAPLEIKAYLVNGGQALTESWLYQWRPAL